MRAKELFRIACVVMCVIMMIQGFALVANDEGAEEWTERSGIDFENGKGDTFYYSGDKRVVLFNHPVKVISISRQGEGKVIEGVPGLRCFESSEFLGLDLIKYEYRENDRKVRDSVMRKYHLLPFYYDRSRLESWLTGIISVELKDDKDFDQLDQMIAPFNCEVVKSEELYYSFATIRVKPEFHENPINVSRALQESGLFKTAAPWLSCKMFDFSYDPDVKKQWGLWSPKKDTTYKKDGKIDKIYELHLSASKAWNYATGRNVTVAVIDGGISLKHIDLKANIDSLRCYDAETGTKPSRIRDKGHGTQCAGIIGAIRNNNLYAVGIAPDSKLMSVSIKTGSNVVLNKIANAVDWAWQNGADVINCSWSCKEIPQLNAALLRALTKGRNGKGCVVVTSAGNDGGDVTYPGSLDDRIIVVSAINSDGSIWSKSCHGKNVHVSAPGINILSTTLNDTVSYFSGTSAAAPHVAAVAALMLERNPNLTNVQVRDIIAKSVKKIGPYEYSDTVRNCSRNDYYGYGLVDAYEALRNTKRPGEK